MGESAMVIGFGVANVLLVIIVTYMWFWWRPSLQRERDIAEGIFKLILYTHGSLSLDKLEEMYTDNHNAGIPRDDIIYQLSLVKGSKVRSHWYSLSMKEEYTIADIEKENKFSGMYSPNKMTQNLRYMREYNDWMSSQASSYKDQSDIKTKQARLMALQNLVSNY